MNAVGDPTIAVKNLTFKFPGGIEGLKDINLDLPAGSRALLIGGPAYIFLALPPV